VYTLCELSSLEFSQARQEWDALLAKSDADPLFMSWAWQMSWWDVWKDELELQLRLLGVYDEKGALAGLAPLYEHRFRTPVGWEIVRLHAIGNAWKLSPTVRTEYVQFIVERENGDAILAAITDYLAKLEWDELIIPDADEAGMARWEQVLKPRADVSKVIRSESEGMLIDTTGRYGNWLANLGKNTRLKAYNRRDIFERELQGQFVRWERPVEFLEQLNGFHQNRWGKPCFDSFAIRFHKKLLERMGNNQSARLSVLMSGNDVVSVLYDIRAGSRVYNLQAGFAEDLHGKVSLGTLHLGYAIEQAFHEPDILGYDLLAGAGKNTFYKRHFKGETIRFTTVEYVRSPLLKAAYGARSWLPQRLVSSINRFFRL
jgi:hypothetical protein